MSELLSSRMGINNRVAQGVISFDKQEPEASLVISKSFRKAEKTEQKKRGDETRG